LKEYFPPGRNLAFPGGQPKQKIIAAIPAYNEAKYIGQVIRQTKPVCVLSTGRKYVHQVIVVDDGSAIKIT